MVPIDEQDEDDLVLEEVERRTAPRGLFPGMTATVLEGAYQGTVFEVGEASRRGVFLRVDAPDSIPLGTRFLVDVCHGDRVMRCEIGIARKEIAPRRGVAGMIKALDDASAKTLAEIIASASVEPAE